MPETHKTRQRPGWEIHAAVPAGRAESAGL